MGYWTRVRPRNEESILLESDSAKELWYNAYSLARSISKGYKTVTFRIYGEKWQSKRWYLKGLFVEITKD